MKNPLFGKPKERARRKYRTPKEDIKGLFIIREIDPADIPGLDDQEVPEPLTIDEYPTSGRWEFWNKLGGELKPGRRWKLARPHLMPYMRPDAKPEGIRGTPMLMLLAAAFFLFLILRTLNGFSNRANAEVPQVVKDINATYTAVYMQSQDGGAASPSPVLTLSTAVPTNPPPVLALSLPTDIPLPVMSTVDAPSMPTFTPSPTFTPAPGAAVKLRLGFFYPEYGGAHCPASGCSDRVADGRLWSSRVGLGAACPDSFDLGSVVLVDGVGAWECIERLPLSVCHSDGVCDVLILARESVVAEWTYIYEGWLVD